MGYCVDMNIVSCAIPASKVPDALKALNAMHDEDKLEANASGGSYGGSSEGKPVRERKWYSWVGNPPEGGWTDLKDGLDEWRYEGNYDAVGNFIVNYFSGEKLGDDEQLWRVLAPFAPGMEIECRGECGALWRWIEWGGEFAEQYGKVTYGDF